MPSYISKNGEWFAAQEKAVNVDTGEVYLGPDREASEFIKTETGGNSDHIGIKANEDPQMIEVARQHGLSIDEWMARHKPTEAQEKIRIEAQSKVVDQMKPSVKKPGVGNTKGGFVDKDDDFVKDYLKK